LCRTLCSVPNLSDLAKWAAPAMSRAIPAQVSRAAGIYLDVVQGKGSGTGWDMVGETAADATVLRDIARPTILDGGANYGQWARAINTVLHNPDATFYLFEPQEECQVALRRAGLPNATVIQAALGDHAGEAVLSGAAPGYGAASIYERHDTYFGDMSAHQERVSMVTLDEVIAQYSIDRVDLLKLDVEGAELAALRGAQASLANGVIRAVGFEFGSANIYSRTFFRDFWELLSPLGFHFARVRPGGRLLSIEEYSEEHEHFRGVSNYLTRR
jgi:FkbM family methyltransferase